MFPVCSPLRRLDVYEGRVQRVDLVADDVLELGLRDCHGGRDARMLPCSLCLWVTPGGWAMFRSELLSPPPSPPRREGSVRDDPSILELHRLCAETGGEECRIRAGDLHPGCCRGKILFHQEPDRVIQGQALTGPAMTGAGGASAPTLPDGRSLGRRPARRTEAETGFVVRRVRRRNSVAALPASAIPITASIAAPNRHRVTSIIVRTPSISSATTPRSLPNPPRPGRASSRRESSRRSRRMGHSPAHGRLRRRTDRYVPR